MSSYPTKVRDFIEFFERSHMRWLLRNSTWEEIRLHFDVSGALVRRVGGEIIHDNDPLYDVVDQCVCDAFVAFERSNLSCTIE